MASPGARRATILVIGDELLAGEVTDRNGPWLADELSGQGVRVREIRTLPDEVELIRDAVQVGLTRADLVILCGGLGPTSDDRTTEAVALALDRELERSEVAWEQITTIFAAFGVSPPPPGNEKQADIPQGAELLPNPRGTAPGYLVREDERLVAVLPGPPRENRRMFKKELLPRLQAVDPDRPRFETTVFRVFGVGESEVGQRLHGLEDRFEGVHLGFQAHFPEIIIKLRAEADRAEAQAAAGQEVEAALAPHLYATGHATLPEVLGRALCARNLKMVTAESCTGGLVAKLLTDVPGSSGWFDRGLVTYSNQAKKELLGVPEAVLAEHGAVSEPVARAMLEGALARSGADMGVALTGVAGPTGGTEEKPVGTVCLAWGSQGAIQVRTRGFRWDRERNRLVSAWFALHRLYRQITGEETV